MVVRRLLTTEFLRDLKPPDGSEYWISDTKIRGFGVRVWANERVPNFCYAIRKSDPQGRSVRKSLNLDALRWRDYESADYAFRVSSPGSYFARDLASFLPEARKWAQLEIAKITGQIESDEALEAARKLDAKYREEVGLHISGLKLTRCVELVFRSAKHRGWTQEYQDRLWRAYWLFDEVSQAGELTIAELGNGLLVEKMKGAPIGHGNLRLLRSLLRIVAENVQALGGPSRWRLLSDSSESYTIPNEENLRFLEGLSGDDFGLFLSDVRRMDASWQSKLSIELSFHLSAPFSRILSGRWSQVVQDLWYPYELGQRKYGFLLGVRIEGPAAECLNFATQAAAETGIHSDYWFPADKYGEAPIRNVDRTWRRALRDHDWPEISLGYVTKYYNRVHYWRTRMPLIT